MRQKKINNIESVYKVTYFDVKQNCAGNNKKRGVAEIFKLK